MSSTCDSFVYGCTDSTYTDYSASYTTMPDGGCEGYQPILGCATTGTLNFDSIATDDDGSCRHGEGQLARRGEGVDSSEELRVPRSNERDVVSAQSYALKTKSQS